MKGGYRPNSGRKEGSIPWNKGVPMSKESKLKISLSKKGSKAWNKGVKSGNHGNGFKKGQVGIWRGKRFSPEYRKKLALAKGNDCYDPENVISRRARMIKNGGFHTNGEWETMKAQYNWTCNHCGKSEPEIKLTKDHIIPVSKGGSDNIENLQPLCRICNIKKSAH